MTTAAIPEQRLLLPLASRAIDDAESETESVGFEPQLPPAQPVGGPRGNRQGEIEALFRDVLALARAAEQNPAEVDPDEIINVIEKLMLMLAREERKARHDRFDAKMTKLVQRIEKMLASARKTLEAGKKELDAINKKSMFQLIFTAIAMAIVLAASIAAIVMTGGAAAPVVAAVLMGGLALGGMTAALGGPIGEQAARGDTEKKHELHEESADLNAVATELEKLMENEGELSAEAKELLRKLLEVLMKIFEKLNATRRKASEGVG